MTEKVLSQQTRSPFSNLDGSCPSRAPEWEERRRFRAEELVTIHDTNKLLNDNDSLELFKETVPSPSLMQLQSDKRGVAHRARTVVKTSLGSSRVNSMSLRLNSSKVISMTDEVVSSFQPEQNDDDNKKTSCLIDIGRAQDEDTPTEQQQHWHSNQQQSTQQDVQQKMRERGREGGEEDEKGRNDEGRRGQEGKRKEKERETEVKKDVTDWTVVTRIKRQRKMAQILVKVNGSKATPMEVNLTDDKVEDVMRQNQKDEDVHVTMHGKGHEAGCGKEEDTRIRRAKRRRDQLRAPRSQNHYRWRTCSRR